MIWSSSQGTALAAQIWGRILPEKAQLRRQFKMRRISVVCATLLVASLALAQAPAGPPQPGPEHKRLEYFVGKWSGEGTMKESVFGPAGKMTMTETCEWFTGGFAIVCKSTGTMAGLGEMKGLAIMAYNPET